MDILTTQMNGGYRAVSGTSASAPLVTGIAGLIKAQHPWLDAAAIRVAIIEGARPVEGLTGKVSSGGVAHAANALARLRGSVRPPNNGGDDDDDGDGNRPRQSPRPGPPQRGGGGSGPSGGFATTPPPPPTGIAATLPNLDAIRNLTPPQPQAPAAIRSNMARCSPSDVNYPDCDGTYDPPGNDPDSSTPRTYPQNETGGAGVDLGSRNFNWNTPLVGLKGRSGLDVGIALVYNSLVWTRDGNTMRFNADRGFPGPGFHLGFPEIQSSCQMLWK